MMDAEDVLTGEKIAGSGRTEWAAVLDRYASSLVDILAPAQWRDRRRRSSSRARTSPTWVAANRPKRRRPRSYRSMDSARSSPSRLAAFDPKVLEKYWAGAPTGKQHHHPLARRAARAKALLDSGKLGPGNAALSDRLTALRGSAIEASLVTPEMLQASGADPSAAPSAQTIRRASPFDRRLNPSLRASDRRARLLGNARRHACRYDAVEPDNLLGLARRVKKLFPPPDPKDKAAVNEHRKKVVDWARAELNRGVMAHELGHSMGLRHNFGASFDSLNYEPEYWQLRTGDGNVTAPTAPTAPPTARSAWARAGATRSATPRSMARSSAFPPRA
jgi:hypothetical protein